MLNNAMSYSRKKDKAKKKSLPICSSPHLILLRNLLNRMYDESQAEKWLIKAQNATRNDPDITVKYQAVILLSF